MHPAYSSDPHLAWVKAASAQWLQPVPPRVDEDVRRLVIACHGGDVSARRQLVDRGVLRRDGPPQGEYAEWLVETWLSGVRAPIGQPGWDVRDTRGHTVSVKSRFWQQNTSFDNLKLRDSTFRFDCLVGIFFWSERDFAIRGVLYAPYAVVAALAREDNEKPGYFRLRWNRANEAQLLKLYWASDRQ